MSLVINGYLVKKETLLIRTLSKNVREIAVEEFYVHVWVSTMKDSSVADE